jgi:hypothetical protein
MDFIKVIPIEETYLRVFEKPPKVRLTRQIISFNYANLSPYSNGGHLSWQTDSSIFVWYLKKPQPQGMAIVIPEAYLAWRFFKERANALVLIPRQGLLSILVMQNGALRAQMTRAAGAGEEQALDLLKREYSLHNAEVIRLAPTVTFKVAPRDMAIFAEFDFKPTNLLERLVALVKVPLIAALIIISGFYLYEERQLETLHADKTQYLARLKRANGELQSSLEDVREKTSYWQDFIAKEQAYPDYYRVLASLTDVVQHHSGYLNMVEYTDNRLTVWTGVKSSEADIIKDLLATGIFQEVKLLSSTKDTSKPDFHLYNIAIVLRSQNAGAAAKAAL